jgi:hypothetical protein
VLTHLGPPSCRRHASASYARSQVLFWGCYIAVSNTLAHVSWRRAAIVTAGELTYYRCRGLSKPHSFLDRDWTYAIHGMIRPSGL